MYGIRAASACGGDSTSTSGSTIDAPLLHWQRLLAHNPARCGDNAEKVRSLLDPFLRCRPALPAIAPSAGSR